MIQLVSVTKAYGADVVLDGISFTLGKNEKCALVGRNGSGKTTLFRLICGLEELDGGTIAFGKNYRLGYLSQHIQFSQPSVLEEASLGLLDEERENVYKAEAILFGLGFQKGDLARPCGEFSGGYHLRLHLAKLLLSEPDCLLLDEPTNYLDILSIRWLTRFLQGWQKECIMISHDRQFLDSICTHTLAIHRKGLKRVVGGTEKLFEQIALEEQVFETTRLAIEKKRDHMQSFIDRFGAKNTKAAQAQSRAKAISRLPALEALCEIDNLHFRFPSIETNSKILLSVNDLAFGYDKSAPPLISGLQLDVEREARVAVVGKNGKGKSTLLRLLKGDLAPLSGNIKSITGLKIGYFGQSHIDSLNQERTIEEEIYTANPKLSMQEVRSIAGKMMFTQARSEKRIGVLSGGERSRVVLGKLLASPCHLLLLDEPTNHLDVESMEAFIDALEEFSGAVVIVSHSELLLERLADNLVVFHEEGVEYFLGSYGDFLRKGGWQSDEAKAPVLKTSSYKESKRLRAEMVTERAKALKPHLNKIEALEKRIVSLEEEVALQNRRLLEAVEAANSAEIPSLSRSIKEKQNEIEKLFTELEEAHRSTVTIKEQFEEKLNSL